LQVLSNLHYFPSGFMNYFWSFLGISLSLLSVDDILIVNQSSSRNSNLEIVPAFLKELICKVHELLVPLLELSRFRILLAEWEEGQSEFLTQGTVSIIPIVFSWSGSISSNSFLPSVLLWLVIIVAVISVHVTVVVVVESSFVIKLSFVITWYLHRNHSPSPSDGKIRFPSSGSQSGDNISLSKLLEFNPGASLGFGFLFVLSAFVMLAACTSRAAYKFPLPVKVVANVRRIEMTLPEVCTAIEEKKKKLPVKDRWQLL
nr:hypothetical protein [Tanacetum cinerariifolium]